MQHVKISWLRRLNYGLVGATAVLFLTHLMFARFGVSQSVQDHWGITSTILALGAIHAIYVIVSDRLTLERWPWLTMLVSFILYGFLHGAIIEASGNTNLVYRATYMVLLFFMGMVGVYPPVTAIVITWSVLLMTVAGIATPTKASLLFNLTVDTLLTVSAFVGWRFFRRYYVNAEDQEARKLQGILQQEQSKSNLILESITDGVMIINPRGSVQLINKSACDMLGWTKEEALNVDYQTMLIPFEESKKVEEKTPDNIIGRVMDSGQAAQGSGMFQNRSKQTLYLDVSASPIRQAKAVGGEPTELGGVVVVFRDISSSRAEEQRRADFVSTASHEMRTPVAAIEGYLALALNDKVSQIDSKARGYLEKAHESTQHLGRLFQDLLTSTKAEDGRLSNHPVVIEMSSFTEKAAEDLRFSAEKKGLEMQFVMGTHEGETINATPGAKNMKMVKPLYYVLADPERLREVITNLFDNAVKYTESGSVSLGLTGNKDVVQLSVRDTGPGIPAADVPHLFQKFYRVDSSATRTIGGTGLGLFICAKIIDLYNGRIWVESEVGKGSTFYINLPRLDNDKARAIQVAESEAAATTVAPLSPESAS